MFVFSWQPKLLWLLFVGDNGVRIKFKTSHWLSVNQKLVTEFTDVHATFGSGSDIYGDLTCSQFSIDKA